MMKSKPASKKSTPTKSNGSSTGPLAVNSQTSAEIRKIENGFVVRESWTKGTGRNQTWGSKEYFSPTNPLQGANSKMSFGKKK